MNLICACKCVIKQAEVWLLNDNKDFTKRKLIFANCPNCGEPVVTLIETRISDNQQFINANISGFNAVRVLYNERKRIAAKYENLKTVDLYGWIYGVNVGIKNKKGEITQVRQYASDYNGKKKLVKKIYQN